MYPPFLHPPTHTRTSARPPAPERPQTTTNPSPVFRASSPTFAPYTPLQRLTCPPISLFLRARPHPPPPTLHSSTQLRPGHSTASILLSPLGRQRTSPTLKTLMVPYQVPPRPWKSATTTTMKTTTSIRCKVSKKSRRHPPSSPFSRAPIPRHRSPSPTSTQTPC